MKIRPIAAVAGLAASLLLGGVAQAQLVYRCGNEYSTQPCPDGGKVVEATDPRSAAQRAEARRVAEKERQLAAQMKKDRLAAEAEKAAQTTAPAAGFDSRKSATAASAPDGGKKKPAKKSAKKKSADDTGRDDFIAVDPKTVGKKK